VGVDDASLRFHHLDEQKMKLPLLSDDAIDELAMKQWPKDEWVGVRYILFARAVEKAAIEAYKASLKPVAWASESLPTTFRSSEHKAYPIPLYRLDDQP